MTLALTGATGFVGSRFLDDALAAGHDVRALARRPQPARDGVDWVAGDLDDAGALATMCEGADAVVHIAGLIKATTREAFEAANAGGTMNLVEAARGAGVRRFVLLSSLAAREPELSDYGWSKARGEAIVMASGLDWTIIRPPAVYGPGDRETLELFRMAKRGVVLLPPGGRFSLLEVGDLARLLLAVLERPEAVGAVYEPDDGRANGWEHRHFARTLGRLYGRRVGTVRAGRGLMTAASRVERLFRRDQAKLTADRVRYLLHPDWVAAADRRPPPSLWAPAVHTPTGLKRTAEWYGAQGWLR